MQGQAWPQSLAPEAFRLVQVRNAQVTHRLIDMRIRSWCTCWPLHRLRTACAQSHFGVLFINRTKALFFITKKSIISSKSPGFIIFWRTLICSPVIITDSGLCFITFTLWNSNKSEGYFGFYYRRWNDHYKSEGNLRFYYRQWNDRPNRGLSKIMPATNRVKNRILVVTLTTKKRHKCWHCCYLHGISDCATTISVQRFWICGFHIMK